MDGGFGPAGQSDALLLGVVLCDEVAELFDDGVDEFLSVSVRLPELSEDVVLPARLPHPGDKGGTGGDIKGE